MLNRQKSILYMMETAGRPVQHLELTKWAFLLAHEMPSGGGRSFYQFLPYRLGPFSFSLYQEVRALVRNGYLTDSKVNGRDGWKIVQDVHRPTGEVPQLIRSDVARVVAHFRDMSTDGLLKYVYHRFPWFTVNSIRRRLQARPVASPAVFTVGYEGRSVDAFLNLLIRTGVGRVLDVRRNPVSRRYGFHERTLKRLCKSLQIEYLHFPELGIPSKLRGDLKTLTDYEALFICYEKTTLGQERAALKNVADLIVEQPSVLLCMERDPSRCHRSRVARAIAKRTGLSVRHLGATYETGV